MKKRPRLYGACYYCVCTACTRFKCPFKHKSLKHCTTCQERDNFVPRLDCDYFEHYLKIHRYRFKRSSSAVPAHFGTYILISHDSVMVGEYDKLYPLWRRLGGSFKKFDIIRGV